MSYLLTGLVATIVSVLVTLLISERRIAAENVIQERMKWREMIRDLASCVDKELRGEADEAKLGELCGKFRLRLNPHDSKDHQILALISQQGANANRADEFTQRVSLLLKHDWERAKREASLCRRFWEKEPSRLGFEDYKPGCAHDYRVGRFAC